MKTWNKAFGNAKTKAESLLKSPEKTNRLLDSALKRSSSAKNAAQLGSIAEKLQAVTRMIRSYVNRDYKDIPWQTLILVTGALVYFVSPIDAIADFIPLLGFADDVAIITAVISSINHDLEKFLEWERSGMPYAEIIEEEKS
jgi:uncharacterized membrane protein YkvA (DUF1232 family)